MVSAIEHTQPRRAKRVLGIGVVAIAHVAYIVVAYRSRALTPPGLWSSDVVVFALPTLLAFGGYVCFLHRPRTSWLLAFMVSIVLTFLSLWVSLFIAFNTYGT
jgi:hypothetical protein